MTGVADLRQVWPDAAGVAANWNALPATANYPAIAVVDSGGHLITLERPTGTVPATPPIATGKAKTAAIITLKTLIVNAPGDLREALEPLTDRKLIDRCARLLPGGVIADTTASTKHALRALATRWLVLSTEIEAHDGALDAITKVAV